MKEFYIIARPSPIDLMQNRFPHNNPLAKVIIAASLTEVLSASNTQLPDKSPNERTFQHLPMPKAMIIYHATGDIGQHYVAPGTTDTAYGGVFENLDIKDIEVFLSDDPLHNSVSQKGTTVDVICSNMSFDLWNRVARLEEYTQAYHVYKNTPPEAFRIWFQNVAKAEGDYTWNVPFSGAGYFNMYYEMSPFKGDIERSAHYATAKTAMSMRQSNNKGDQEFVLRALEDNAMNTLKNVSVLYGHQVPTKDCEQQILKYTLPLLNQIQPAHREALVKGIQTSAELWAGESAETILTNACYGFLRNHPQYKLDTTLNDVLESMHSPVPMMVFGYWEGAMQQKYKVGINDEIQKVFANSLSNSDGYSEMRRIGEAIADAQQALIKQGYALYDLPSGMEVAQAFTATHLENGMHPPVCMAWLPDDIRPNIERVFEQQLQHKDNLLAMTYALAAAMQQCNQLHDSAHMMRDNSTVMNEVVMRAYKAGVYPQDITDIMNDAFGNNATDVYDDFEEHN